MQNDGTIPYRTSAMARASMKQRSRDFDIDEAKLPLVVSVPQPSEVYESQSKTGCRIHWQLYTHSGTPAEVRWIILMVLTMCLFCRGSIAMVMNPLGRTTIESSPGDGRFEWFSLPTNRSSLFIRHEASPPQPPLSDITNHTPALMLPSPERIREDKYERQERERDDMVPKTFDPDDQYQPVSSKQDKEHQKYR